MNHSKQASSWIAGIALLALPLMALADGRAHGNGGGREGGDRPRGHELQLDRRYSHDRYYPRPGVQYQRPPPGGFYRPWRGDSFYFRGGVWYRPWGPRYLVVRPPIGIGIEVLPAFYTTVWFGGVPYYYADGIYYVWEPLRREYVVSNAPAGDEAGSTAPPAEADLYAYPKNGQGEQQQSSDRYACHQWAREQSGFDPTQPLGGVGAREASDKRADYRRAERTCLEGRGYSVN